MNPSLLFVVIAVIVAAYFASFTLRLLRRVSTPVQPQAPDPVATPRPLQVLLAEDNPVIQQLAVELLQMRGYAVELASNGKEVLAALDKNNFDVILMDVNMPEMDGYQTTAAIREKEKANGSHLRIIALTGSALKDDRERCLKAGMDGYLSKPIRSRELFEAVEQGTA